MMASVYKIDQKKESSDRCKKNTKDEKPSFMGSVTRSQSYDF
jgi:hypothetical protein